jgi:2-dehydro-3-deoxy-D-arabinonate dehydratase
MILYRVSDGFALEHAGSYYRLEETSLDDLIGRPDLHSYLSTQANGSATRSTVDPAELQAPVGQQEVWAAGVTYYRSRTARMEESEQAGGSSFYDRVYSAERPELFFKALPHKVVGPGAAVAIRSDAQWSVPEPELALLINPSGQIVGYTIGNDMSSRDIEGQNLLYLPQAKIYDRSCALGPGILISQEPLPPTTAIEVEIARAGQTVFSGKTALSEMKRRPEELVQYLFRDQTFTHGCFLLTGTGIVPPDSFTLLHGDTIRISIEDIGVLINQVG